MFNENKKVLTIKTEGILGQIMSAKIAGILKRTIVGMMMLISTKMLSHT